MDSTPSVVSTSTSSSSSSPSPSSSTSPSPSSSSTSSSSYIPTERFITLSPELTLSALTYGDSSSPLRILGIHGWVDNAATFDLVVPILVDLGFYFVAIDLPGHGKSNHRPPSCYYSAIEYSANVLEVIEILRWDSCFLIGHSLGGGLCTVVASVLGERIHGLMLIENLGLSYRSVDDAPDLFLKAVQSKRTLARKNDSSFYNSIEDAVNQRMLTATTHPGKQYISKEGAERLVKRALVPVEIKNNDDNTNITSTATEPSTPPSVTVTKYKFRHDRRIYAPALLSASEDHILSFLKRITCPILLVTAASGWPFPSDIFTSRLQAIKNVLKIHVHLPGSHHLHLDNDTAPAVNKAVKEFLQSLITVGEG